MLSIIIPAYNCESTIENCIKSFVNDDLDIEIIIVNDGSTDNTEIVLKKLQNMYKSIKVINQQNGGAAHARNAGLLCAEGDYVGFIDADDFVDENYFSELYKYALYKNLDMVMGNVKRSYSCAYIPFEHNRILYKDEIMKQMIPLLIAPFHERDYKKVIPCAMWAYIFRRSMLEEKHIKFYNVKNGQDSLFTLECSCCSSTLGIIKNVYYHYLDNDNSLSKQFTIDRYQRLIKSSEYISEILTKYNIVPYPAYQMDQLDRHHVYFSIRQIIHQDIPKTLKKTLMLEVLNNPVSQRAFKTIIWKDLNYLMKILYYLIKNKCINSLIIIISIRDRFL